MDKSPAAPMHTQCGGPQESGVGARQPSHGSAPPQQPCEGPCMWQDLWSDVTLPFWTPQGQGRCWHTVQCTQDGPTDPEQHPLHSMHTERTVQQIVHSGCMCCTPCTVQCTHCTARCTHCTAQCTQHTMLTQHPAVQYSRHVMGD